MLTNKEIEEPTQQLRKTVTNYMRQEIDNCVDPKTDEVNHTQLAENAAAQYNLYLDTTSYTIPEWVFDMAVDVAERHG